MTSTPLYFDYKSISIKDSITMESMPDTIQT